VKAMCRRISRIQNNKSAQSETFAAAQVAINNMSKVLNNPGLGRLIY
jgi:hypothetical protein